jgi:hypothetical protein
LGHGKTIHASGQLESFGNQVDERSKLVANGKQHILTTDGFNIPLDIVQGLAYMKIRAPSDDELLTLPHVIFTSDTDWDPTILDNINNDIDSDPVRQLGHSLDIRISHGVDHGLIFQSLKSLCMVHCTSFDTYNISTKPAPIDLYTYILNLDGLHLILSNIHFRILHSLPGAYIYMMICVNILRHDFQPLM